MPIPSEAWIALISVLAGSGLTGAISICITKLNQAHEMNKMQAQQRRFYDELNHKHRMEFMVHSCDALTKVSIAANGVVSLTGDVRNKALQDFYENWMKFINDIPKAHLFLAKDELDSHQEVIKAMRNFWNDVNVENLKAINDSCIVLTCNYKAALGIESSIPETLSKLYPGGMEEFASLLEKRYGPRESDGEADTKG